MTLDDDQIVERWLESKAPNSREIYARDLTIFRAFVGADKPLSSIELGDVQRYAKHLTKAKSALGRPYRKTTQANMLNAVKSFYSFATKHSYLPVNPTLAIKVPKAEETLAERLMTEVEVEQLIQAATNPRDHLMMRFIFISGARTSEVRILQWRHIKPNDNGGQVTLYGKGSLTRIVVIPLETYTELIELQGQVNGQLNEYVFPSQKGGPLSRHQIFRVVKKAAERAGLSWAISTHWLRHAHATLALENNAPLSLIQHTLGHADIRTTQKYLHARPDESSALYLPRKKATKGQ